MCAYMEYYRHYNDTCKLGWRIEQYGWYPKRLSGSSGPLILSHAFATILEYYLPFG